MKDFRGDFHKFFLQFFKIGQESMNCRTKASLINISYFCKMFLTGPQATEAANWIFTADTNKEANK